jgi:NAD(P)-dependent dehydrogenase (short-subunit alcohol dehydrogenase family)
MVLVISSRSEERLKREFFFSFCFSAASYRFFLSVPHVLFHLLPSEAVKDLTASTGGKCDYRVMDVRKPEQVQEVVNDVVKKFGRIDILINGAAGNFLAPAEKLTINAFKTVMDIDAVGLLLSFLVSVCCCPLTALSCVPCFLSSFSLAICQPAGTFIVTKAVFHASMKKHGGSIINITMTFQITCVCSSPVVSLFLFSFSF